MFSYIIIYKNENSRLNCLKKVLNHIKNLECEIIIVEQVCSNIAPLEDGFLDDTITHITVKTNNMMNRSWLRNIGANEANTEVIVFGDADLIIDKEILLKAVNEVKDKKHDFISPYNRVIDLSIEQNQLPINEILELNKEFGRGEDDIQKINIAGGLSIFNRNKFYEIGGWPEEFVGWGGEDDAMTIKIKTFLNWCEYGDMNIYHLYHPKSVVLQTYYYNNLNILNERYFKMDRDQLIQYISNIKTIGE